MLVKIKIALENQKEKLENKLSEVLKDQKGEIGIGVILGVALVFIVFGFIVIPQARTFAGNMFTDLNAWYTTNISNVLFPAS